MSGYANFAIERDSIVDTQISSTQTRVPQFPEQLPQLAFQSQGSVAFDTTSRQLAYFDGFEWIYGIGSKGGVSVFKLGNQAITEGTNAIITGWTDAAPGYNTLEGFDLATGIFTAPVAGEYKINTSVVWVPTNQGTQRTTQILVNGLPIFAQTQDPNLVSNFADGQSLIQYVAGSVRLEIGDTVSINTFNNSGVIGVIVLATSVIGSARTSLSINL